jgi:anthranilate phosphoribosyltransferase
MGERTWANLLAALLRGEELSTSDTSWAMGEIMSGDATGVQIASFAIALRAKGETPAEIAGLVEAMLAAAVRVRLPEATRTSAVDVVGTGGDRAHTVNISTMAALVVAGAGVPVIKHGNRAASSSCGAADLLEFLGVPLELGPDEVATSVAEAGIGFCFAARFHPGMRHAGVPLAPTRVWAVTGGTVTESVIDAVDLGIPRAANLSVLRGADAAFNGDVARRLLAGETGPVRDAVVLNAGAALAARAGFTPDDLPTALRAGIDRAQAALDSGAAQSSLDNWIATASALA